MEQTGDGGNRDERGTGLFGGPGHDHHNLNGPDQAALFRIEGPDEDGCVWLCSVDGKDVWCQNLGPFRPAAEVMAEWLEANDYGE